MEKMVSDTPISDIHPGIAAHLASDIAKKCVRNEEGDLLCKKCHSKVMVDWFEYGLECLGCDEIE